MFILAILALLAACSWLLKARPFKTCPRCNGFGSKTRLLGGPVPCRACHGTGLRKRSQRRKARRLLGNQPARRVRR
jgi:DnaJ-class molecular chaperone